MQELAEDGSTDNNNKFPWNFSVERTSITLLQTATYSQWGRLNPFMPTIPYMGNLI